MAKKIETHPNEHESPSISRDFTKFGLLVVSIFLLLSGWFIWRTYTVQTLEIEKQLKQQTKRIENSFISGIDYSAHLMGFIGKQIARQSDDGKDLKAINQLLSSYRIIENEILTWSTFTWSDKDHDVTVTSNKGIMPKPYRSLAYRDYIPETITEPSRIHLGDPVYGITSGLWSIPAGYGIVNDNGDYLGAVITGFVVDGLRSRIENTINIDGISFILLDEENKVITQSSVLKGSYTAKKIIKLLDASNVTSSHAKLLQRSTLFDPESSYVFYQPVLKYPYRIVVTYDKHLGDHKLLEAIINRILEFFAIAVLILALFYLLRRNIIKPIMALSNAASKIASDESDVTLPESDTKEISNLSKQLRSISQYKKELIAAKEQAERSNRYKSIFLANMSHELRTPLGAIINFSDMIRSETYGQVKAKYKEYAGDIHEAGIHLYGVINDILDLSKAEAGKMELWEDYMSVPDEIAKAIHLVEKGAEEKHITINTSINGQIPLLYADSMRFEQIMLNLLSNAIKFSKEGASIEIEVSINANSNLEISVQDHGIGINKKDIEKITTEYGQARDAMSRKEDQGTGLGIPITKMLVELHKGKFSIASVVNEGTTVTLVFPSSRLQTTKKRKKRK